MPKSDETAIKSAIGEMIMGLDDDDFKLLWSFFIGNTENDTNSSEE